jgi:hypothetical protein
MPRTILLFFHLSLVCCKQSISTKVFSNFKDSVVKAHLARIDSLDFYDTTTYDYKILKAYINNDSAFFKQIAELIKQSREEIIKYPDLDTCVHFKKLSDLGVEEAYRFKHSQSFCDFSQIVTISRTNDSIILSYIEYGFVDGGKTAKYQDQDGHRIVIPGCKIVKEFVKRLSSKNWEELDSKVDDADYWGLKHIHDKPVLDGSGWQIEAYIKKPNWHEGPQIHSVARNSPSNPSFRELGMYFLKLAGERGKCGTIN